MLKCWSLLLQIRGNEPRNASKKILKNRGLVPHRAKMYRNPRIVRKKKYEKAKKRIGGQVCSVAVCCWAGTTCSRGQFLVCFLLSLRSAKSGRWRKDATLAKVQVSAKSATVVGPKSKSIPAFAAATAFKILFSSLQTPVCPVLSCDQQQHACFLFFT